MEAQHSNTQASRYSVTWAEVYRRVSELPGGKVYGIPRGGAICAGITGRAVDTVEECDYILDDIYDSGRTAEKYSIHGKPIHFLFDKRKEHRNVWVEFPWENTNSEIEDTIVRSIQFIGEDCSREGLKDTPRRVVKAWGEIFSGYNHDPRSLLTTFSDEKYSGIVLLKDIEFYSTCEHHMLPFYGKAHVAYIPKDKIIGVSKLARLLDIFSKRLQIQERIGDQVADFLMTNLDANGAACIIEARHFCMTSRGVMKQGSKMITSSIRGAFKQVETRNELIELIRG